MSETGPGRPRPDEMLVRWVLGAMFAVIMFTVGTLMARQQFEVDRLVSQNTDQSLRLSRIESRADVLNEIVRSMDRRIEFLEQARSVPK